eukprot:Sspe_Gene.17865::Locus_6384_Transcript_2_2_Confidence_0.500_Length_10291::g.17865::m.17865
MADPTSSGGGESTPPRDVPRRTDTVPAELSPLIMSPPVGPEDDEEEEEEVPSPPPILMPAERTYQCEQRGPMLHYHNQFLFLSRKSSQKVEETVRSTMTLLQSASKFNFFAIMRGSDKERKEYSCRQLNPKKMFPIRKRLGHVFLSLLGRTNDQAECVPYVPRVSLGLRKLVERTDYDTEIVISAETIDEVCRKEEAMGIGVDEVWDRYMAEAKEGKIKQWVLSSADPNGPPACEIYGRERFAITIKELQQLERTTRFALSSDIPAPFFSELVRFISKDPKRQRFFELRRSVPLEQIGQRDKWEEQRDELLRTYEERKYRADENISKFLKQRNKLLHELATLHKVERITEICGSLEEVDYRLDDQRVIARNSEIKISDIRDGGRDNQIIAEAFEEFIQEVRKAPSKYGFSDGGGENLVLKKALTELCTGVCLSQKGYFFVDGRSPGFDAEDEGMKGDHNQLTGKTRQTITFLSSPGLDFCDPSTTALEAKKYFRYAKNVRSGESPWRGFKQGAWRDLLYRLRRLYEVIFRSCKYHSVRNPSMLPMGLGVFLYNVHKSDQEDVKRAYFTAQWQLLAEYDWGFHNYFLNAGPHRGTALATLEKEITEGRPPRCNVIIHDRDVKFLAVEMAKTDSFLGPAMLNPSDCASLCLGLMGYFWEWGRQENYVGEEDFCCTGTGTLALVSITTVFNDPSRHIGGSTFALPPIPQPAAFSASIPQTEEDVRRLVVRIMELTDDEEIEHMKSALDESLNDSILNGVLRNHAFKLCIIACQCRSCDVKLLHIIFEKLRVNLADFPYSALETTPLHEAALRGHIAAMIYLLENGHELHCARREGGMLQSVFDCSSDTSMKTTLRAAACYKVLQVYGPRHRTRRWTDLHRACATKNYERVKSLLGLVTIDRGGSKPLGLKWDGPVLSEVEPGSIGADYKMERFVGEKLRRVNGAVVKKPGRVREVVETSVKRERVTTLLFSSSVKVNAEDSDKWTPLHWCIVHEDCHLLELLLSHPKTDVLVPFDVDFITKQFDFAGTWASPQGELELKQSRPAMLDRERITEYQGVLRMADLSEEEVKVIVSMRANAGNRIMTSVVLVRRKGEVDVAWDEREMRLKIMLSDTPVIMEKTVRSADGRTTAAHLCCEMGLDSMMMKIVKHNAQALDIVGGPRKEKPFITALLNYHRGSPSSTLISDLLDDTEENTISRNCLNTARESIARPLGKRAEQRGWLLLVLERDQATAASLIAELGGEKIERQAIACSAALYALHNACACLGTRGRRDEGAGGDPVLVTKVLNFLASLRHHPKCASWFFRHSHSMAPHLLNVGNFAGTIASNNLGMTVTGGVTAVAHKVADLLQVSPTEDELAWAESVLELEHWCDRHVVAKAYEWLKRGLGTDTLGYTMDDIRDALAQRYHELLPSESDGLRVIEQGVDTISFLRKEGNFCDAADIEQAFGILLRYANGVEETALQVAVQFERTDVLDMLLDNDAFGSSIMPATKGLLKEAILRQRWQAADMLIPLVLRHQQQEEIDKTVFDALPSSKIRGDTKEYYYPDPPSYKEVVLCSNNALVPRDHFSVVLESHRQWLMKFEPVKATSRAKMIWLVKGEKRELFRITQEMTEDEVKEKVREWLGITDFTIYKANCKVRLVLDELEANEQYEVREGCDEPPTKQVKVAFQGKSTTLDLTPSMTPVDTAYILKKRFHLPSTAQVVVLDTDRRPLMFAAAQEGMTYTMVANRTWADVGIEEKEKVNILRHLLAIETVDLSDFLVANKDYLPSFDFGMDYPRAGELFVVICCKRSTGILPKGFTLNGIQFDPRTDFPVFDYPLHLLLLKGHSLHSENDPNADHYRTCRAPRDFASFRNKSLTYRKRFSDLACEVVKFINRILAAKQEAKVPRDLREFALKIANNVVLPSSSSFVVNATIPRDAMVLQEEDGDSGTDDEAKYHEEKTYTLTDYRWLYPIELAVELHNTDVLRAMVGDDAPKGLVSEDLNFQSCNKEEITATCYCDIWFPDNDECSSDAEASAPLPAFHHPTRRPLLHRSLDLLPIQRLTRYQHEQAAMLDDLRQRSPVITKHSVDLVKGNAVVGIPWYPPEPGAGVMSTLKGKDKDYGVWVESKRREVVRILLKSIVVRDHFHTVLTRAPLQSVDVEVAQERVRICTLFDRCGLFQSVPLDLKGEMRVVVFSNSPHPYRLRFPADATILDVKQRLAEIDTIDARMQRLMLHGTDEELSDDQPIRFLGIGNGIKLHLASKEFNHAGEWRDVRKKSYCCLDDDNDGLPCTHLKKVTREEFIRESHWSCCGSTDRDAQGCKVASPHPLSLGNETPTVWDEWNKSLRELGLAKLLQRAPWVMTDSTCATVLRYLQQHPFRTMPELDAAMQGSYSPVLIERRHQWQRLFRVQDALPDTVKEPPTSFVNHVESDLPGEQDLVIDNGLTLAHWACLLGSTTLFTTVTDRLQGSLVREVPTRPDDDCEGPLIYPYQTQLLQYSCAHYAAYAAHSELIDLIWKWQPSDISYETHDGTFVLNYQVPCACHPNRTWERTRHHKYDKPHRNPTWMDGGTDALDTDMHKRISSYQPLCHECLSGGSLTPHCTRCIRLASAFSLALCPKRKRVERDASMPVVTSLEWSDLAILSNLSNCEGGGGLTHRRVFHPVTAGDTALMVASQFGHIMLTRKLVRSCDVDVGSRNHEGFDAHDVAVALQVRSNMQQDEQSDEEEESKVLEKQVELLNSTRDVQGKLVWFAIEHFVKSAFHLFLFTMVITILSILITEHHTRFFTISSMRTLIQTEEWPTGYVYQGQIPRDARFFREDLSAVLEFEDFHNWFRVPFEGKVLEENPFGLFLLVGSVRVIKQTINPINCSILHRSVLNSDFQQILSMNDSYRMGVEGEVCQRVYRRGDLSAGTSQRWANWTATYESTYSRETYYLEHGEYLDITPNNKENLNLLNDSENRVWVNESTRLVVVFFTFYNPHVDRFVVCEVFFEIFAQGALQPFSRFYGVRISPYQTSVDLWRGLLEILFFIHLFVHFLEEVNDLRCTVLSIRRRIMLTKERGIRPRVMIAAQHLYDHIMSDWNIIDLTVIGLQIYAVIDLISIRSMQAHLRNNPDLLSPDNTEFHDYFIPIAHTTVELERLLGFTTLLAWIKFLKSVVKVPRYGPTVNAIINTITDQKVLVFGIVFMWVLLALLLGLYIAFGTLYSFRSFAIATLTTFLIVLGDSAQFQSLEDENVLLGPIMFLIVIIFGQLVLLNLIVAVLQEVYVDAIRDAQRAWSHEIVEMYKYKVTPKVDPSSITAGIHHALRKWRLCMCFSFKEKMLKRPSSSLHSRRWVVVAVPEKDATLDDDDDPLIQRLSTVEQQLGRVIDISSQPRRPPEAEHFEDPPGMRGEPDALRQEGGT